MKVKKNKKGFTLIELLSIIVILVILIFMAIPAIGNIIETSKRKAFYSSVSLIVNEIKTEQILSENDYCIYTYDKDLNSNMLTNANVNQQDYEYINKLYVLVHKVDDDVVYSVFAVYDRDTDKEDSRTIDLRDFSTSKVKDESTWIKDEVDYDSYTYYSVELIESLGSDDSELLKFDSCVFK